MKTFDCEKQFAINLGVEGESGLSRVLDWLPVAAYAVDAEGRMIGWNERAVEIWGVEPRDHVIAETCELCFGMGDLDSLGAPRHECPMRMAVTSGQVVKRREVEFMRLDGKKRTLCFDIEPILCEDGSVFGAINCFEDITERKRVELEHRLSEERYRALAELSPQMIWLGFVDGRITYGNKALIDYLGLGGQCPVFPSWMGSLHPDDRGKVSAARALASADRGEYETEVRFRRASDGQYRWFQLRGLPFHDSHGRIDTWMGVAIDIHERKISETELKRAKEAAESANDLKSAFLANMSHEIRTPLGAMLGFADLLKDQALSPEERSSYLSIIQRNGEQLLTIINDILDLSKVESGHLLVERVPTDVHEIVRDVVSLLEVKARDKSLLIRSNFRGSLPGKLQVDPVRLKQILVNMVGNAIKFTKMGGIEIVVEYREPRLEIKIIDTGIGIEAERVVGLFRPFMQADESTTRKFGGTGLGLALSRRLARALGGDVVLERSAVGKGTVFTIQVHAEPTSRESLASLSGEAAKVDSGTEVKAALPNESVLEGFRILLVDDSPDNRVFVSRMLEKRGAEVETAINGLEGVQRALKEEFDLILMDLQMPVLDGYSATQRLRETGYMKPIIALTAHAMTEVRKKCLGVGCTDHLAKPVQIDRLINALVRCREHA